MTDSVVELPASTLSSESSAFVLASESAASASSPVAVSAPSAFFPPAVSAVSAIPAPASPAAGSAASFLVINSSAEPLPVGSAAFSSLFVWPAACTAVALPFSFAAAVPDFNSSAISSSSWSSISFFRFSRRLMM